MKNTYFLSVSHAKRYHKFINRNLLALVAVGAISLTGCQTKEALPPTAEEINTYSIPVMDASIRNIITIKACQALGNPIVSEASDAYNIWYDRNKTLVQASDKFSSQYQTGYANYKNIFYSLEVIKKIQQLRLEVLGKLKLSQRDNRNQKTVCRREFRRIQKEELAMFAPSQTIASALLNQRNTPMHANYASTLETAEHNILASEPGRSYFKLNEQFQNACPNSLSLLTLKNTWPAESYAAYCQEEPLALILCDWGKCIQHKPKPYQP